MTCPPAQGKETRRELNLTLLGYCTGWLTSAQGTCRAQHSHRALKQPAAGMGNTWKRKSTLDIDCLQPTSARAHLLSNHLQKIVLSKEIVMYPIQQVVQ